MGSTATNCTTKWEAPEYERRGHLWRAANAYLDDRFHTFALWWSPEEYVFSIDAEEVWRTRAGGVCQVPLYVKLSEEIGNWAGDIAKAALPDRFVVDCVRVYEVADRSETPPGARRAPGVR